MKHYRQILDLVCERHYDDIMPRGGTWRQGRHDPTGYIEVYDTPSHQEWMKISPRRSNVKSRFRHLGSMTMDSCGGFLSRDKFLVWDRDLSTHADMARELKLRVGPQMIPVYADYYPEPRTIVIWLAEFSLDMRDRQTGQVSNDTLVSMVKQWGLRRFGASNVVVTDWLENVIFTLPESS